MFLNVVSKVFNNKTQLFRSIVSHTIQQRAHYVQNGHFDVIIVGGGAAGISLAGSIGKSTILQDKKVLLLDAGPKFEGYDPHIYSNRVYALNKNTTNLLKKIGAWNTIKSIRCQPVKQMQVWDSSSDALITFNHDNFIGNLAYIIENDVLLFAILEEIEKNSNISIQNGAKIEKIQLENDTGKTNEIHLTNGTQFSAELIVGADGANSIVRNQMNVNNFSMRYNQMGLVATVHLKDCENNFIAWQRFLPDGVIALLPLTNELSSIVWSTDTKHFRKLMKLNEIEFVDAVNEAFVTIREYDKNSAVDMFNRLSGNFLKSVNQKVRQLPPQIDGLYQNSRAGFPLGFAHASNYVARGAALIGDSAHRIHPLAGLGLNLGMGDVKCLTEKLEAATLNGARLNNLNYLLQYEQHQLRHNIPIMLGVHAIQQIYNTNSNIVALTRSIGIQFTQKMAPLKNFFMEKAMG